MELFLITFVIMLIAVLLMAIGYIVQRKKIKGSCGGISDLGLEKVCDCEEPCDKRKELIRRQKELQIDKDQIQIKIINHD